MNLRMSVRLEISFNHGMILTMTKTNIVCALIAGLMGTALADDRLRDWTNTSGKTISAELIALDGDYATLKLGNGRKYEVLLSTLSEADGKFAREWQKSQESAAKWSELGITLGVPTEAIVESAFDTDTPRTRKAELLGWQAGIGEWRIEDGALIGDEVAEDNHASSLTHRMEATHLIITAQVQLGTAKQIAFACRDTVPPNLHLGRLYITRDKLWIQSMSGIAKTTKAEKLVTKEVALNPDEWYGVTIEIIGDTYRAKVGDEEIEATHSRFGDGKGIVALVNRGEGAKFRKVALWHAEAAE